MQPGIYRSELPFDKGYVQAPTIWLRDPKLSLQAKGLLVYLLSHQIGYLITRRQIIEQSAGGRNRVDSAIAELVKFGYLKTQHTRQDDGRNGALAFTICDPEAENQPLELPEVENPQVENPQVENQPTKEDNLTKNINILESKKRKTFENDWSLPDDERLKLEQQYPNANLDSEVQAMIDWIIANGKQKDVKDMSAKFRTWMRQADKFNKGAYSTRVMDEWFVKPENRVKR